MPPRRAIVHSDDTLESEEDDSSLVNESNDESSVVEEEDEEEEDGSFLGLNETELNDLEAALQGDYDNDDIEDEGRLARKRKLDEHYSSLFELPISDMKTPLSGKQYSEAFAQKIAGIRRMKERDACNQMRYSAQLAVLFIADCVHSLHPDAYRELKEYDKTYAEPVHIPPSAYDKQHGICPP